MIGRSHYCGDGLTSAEREHERLSERLDELEAQLYALSDFQSEAFDSEGDDEVLDCGADADAAGLACDRILKRHLDRQIGRYIRARYPLSGMCWQLPHQVEAVENLIEKFTPRRSASLFPVAGQQQQGKPAAGFSSLENAA